MEKALFTPFIWTTNQIIRNVDSDASRALDVVNIAKVIVITHYRQSNDGVSAHGEGDNGISRVREGIAAPMCGEDGIDD